MQVYVIYKTSDNSAVCFIPSDTTEENKTRLLGDHVGCQLSSNTIESPEPNEDYTNVVYPHRVIITNGVASIATGDAITTADNAEAARVELNELREERNKRIAETDWWANSDLTMTAEQTAYRQALRDITDTYTSLEDVVWPTKP